MVYVLCGGSSPFVLNVRCLSVINEIALLLFCSASAAFAFLYLHFLLHFVPCLLLLLLLCVGMPRLLWLKSLSALGFYLASHGLLFEMVCLAVRVLATEHCQLVFETPIMGHTNTNCRPTFDCWPKVNSQLLMTVRTPKEVCTYKYISKYNVGHHKYTYINFWDLKCYSIKFKICKSPLKNKFL